MRRWRRGDEDRVDRLSLKEVVIVSVDVRVGEAGRCGGAGSRQRIGNRNDFSYRKIAQRSSVINLRKPAETYDR